MSKYSQAVVCFTDIVNSTQLTAELGSEDFSKLRKEHFELASTLAGKFDGVEVKNIGDGLLYTFSDPKSAAAFACNMQFFYGDQPSKVSSQIKIKVGIESGTVEADDNDPQGGTTNLAARLVNDAGPGEIVVTSEFLKSMKLMFGRSKAEEIVQYKSKKHLKGIDGEIELYSVSVEKFFNADQDDSFYALAKLHMKRLGVSFANISVGEILSSHNTLILPIVPRKNINLVHCGLLEVIRVFSLLGWKTSVLLADFGKDHLNRRDVEDFKLKIENSFAEKNISNFSITILSDLINKGQKESCCSITHDHLYPYLSLVKAGEMQDILGKQYTANEKVQLDKSYLNTLRPIFTLAGVRQMLSNLSGKCLVLSGDDERAMWAKCIKLDCTDKLGGVHIPVITKATGHQYNQNLTDLHWMSQADIIDDMNVSNIADWASKQMLAMEKFPCNLILSSGEAIPEADESVYHEIADKIIDRLR